MATFTTLMRDLSFLDVVPSLVTFLLIFVVLFAILQKTNILGSGKKRYNVIVALCIALIPIVQHAIACGRSTNCNTVVSIINRALPNVSLVIIAIVMALLIIGIFGGEAKWLGGSISGWIAIIAFLVIIYLFAAETTWGRSRLKGWPLSTGWWNSETTSLIIIILVFAIIIWFITKEDNTGEKAEKSLGIIKELGNMFKK